MLITPLKTASLGGVGVTQPGSLLPLLHQQSAASGFFLVCVLIMDLSVIASGLVLYCPRGCTPWFESSQGRQAKYPPSLLPLKNPELCISVGLMEMKYTSSKKNYTITSKKNYTITSISNNEGMAIDRTNICSQT